jgi:hypothetical protein
VDLARDKYNAAKERDHKTVETQANIILQQGVQGKRRHRISVHLDRIFARRGGKDGTNTTGCHKLCGRCCSCSCCAEGGACGEQSGAKSHNTQRDRVKTALRAERQKMFETAHLTLLEQITRLQRDLASVWLSRVFRKILKYFINQG